MLHGAAAIAAIRRRRQDEEENMTPYSARELSENWEFKILRSATGAFKNAATLQRYLAEEAEAGWIFVEKFDNGRIRLKRPASARQNDAMLSFDAYRTNAGMSEGNVALCVSAIIVGILGGALAMLALFVKK